MKKIIMLFCIVALIFTAIPIYALDNKVVVIPLNSSSNSGPGDWTTVSVSSLGAVTRNSTYETVQLTAGDCGYIARTADSGMASGYLVAPIQLPDKATITSLSGLICDNSGLTEIAMELFRSDGPNGQLLAIVDTQGLSQSTTAYKRVTTIINEPVVDNSKYTYWIYMSVEGSDATKAYPISAHITLE